MEFGHSFICEHCQKAVYKSAYHFCDQMQGRGGVYSLVNGNGDLFVSAAPPTKYLCNYCGGTYPLDNKQHLCWHAPDSFEAAHPTHFPRPWREAPLGALLAGAQSDNRGGNGGQGRHGHAKTTIRHKSIMDYLAPHRHKIKG